MQLAFSNWIYCCVQSQARHAYQNHNIEHWLVDPKTVKWSRLFLSSAMKHANVFTQNIFDQEISACTSRGARMWLSRMSVLSLPSTMRDDSDLCMTRSASSFLNGTEAPTILEIMRTSRLSCRYQQQDAVEMGRALQFYDRYLQRMEPVVDVSAQKSWLDQQRVAWKSILDVLDNADEAYRTMLQEQESGGDVSLLNSLLGELRLAARELGYLEKIDLNARSICECMAVIDCAERWSIRNGQVFVSMLILDALQCCMDCIRERALSQ